LRDATAGQNVLPALCVLVLPVLVSVLTPLFDNKARSATSSHAREHSATNVPGQNMTQAQHEQKPTGPLSALSAATTESAPNSSTFTPAQHLAKELGKSNVGGVGRVESQRLQRRLEMFYKRVNPEHLGQVPAIVKVFEGECAITHPLLSQSHVHRVMQREEERESVRESVCV
jgi:hypothetical protein